MSLKRNLVIVLVAILLLLAGCSAIAPTDDTTEHIHTVVKGDERQPNCTEAGYSASSYCKTCGQILSKQIIYPALGHAMGKNGTCVRCHCAMCELTLNPSRMTLQVGETFTAVATMNPVIQSVTVSWKSSDPNVASVTSGGVIEAKMPGTATITATASNGAEARCTVTVEKEAYSNTLLYEDNTVSIHFVSLKKESYGDGLILRLKVKNKVNYDLLIQNDTVVLNGYCFNNTVMSDPVAAGTSGYVDVAIYDVDYSLLDINNLQTVGGQFNIIDDTGVRKTYDAIFTNISLYGKGSVKEYPAAPKNLELLYSDSKVNMYFSHAKIQYDSLNIYLMVENKTNETILIQNDYVIINGTTFSNTIMSDPVSGYSTGLVCVTMYDYPSINPANLKTIGGKFRIISDQENWHSYDAVMGTFVTDDDKENTSATLKDGSYVISANGLTLSALGENDTYGYPDGNNAAAYTYLDVMVITNVTGGFTIQDCYGRYLYAKSTYNSFSVSATVPASGHIWKAVQVAGGYEIINIATGKTIAYHTGYASWGVYANPTSQHYKTLTIRAVEPVEDIPTSDPMLWTKDEVEDLMYYHDQAKYYADLADEYLDTAAQYDHIVSVKVYAYQQALAALAKSREAMAKALEILQANYPVTLKNSEYATFEEMLQSWYDHFAWMDGLAITEDNYSDYERDLLDASVDMLIVCLGWEKLCNEMLNSFN